MDRFSIVRFVSHIIRLTNWTIDEILNQPIRSLQLVLHVMSEDEAEFLKKKELEYGNEKKDLGDPSTWIGLIK